MDSLRQKAEALLAAQTVSVIIGFEEADGVVRPAFVRRPEDATRLIYDERCLSNLAVYLKKKEIKKLGRIGVVAPTPVLRSLLQLAAENQLSEGEFLALWPAPDGGFAELGSFAEIEAQVASSDLEIPEQDLALIKALQAMTLEERLNWWTEQLGKCTKCYACRAACPMCFCGRCQVEYNQPQMVTAESSPRGNFEWHFVRAMHMAGRCVGCGDCARACPEHIPVHLLTERLALAVKEAWGEVAGTSAGMKSVLSTFDPKDGEGFVR